MKKILRKTFILPLIVGVAVAIVVIKVKSRAPIEHQPPTFPTRTVEVIPIEALPFRSRATAYGYVEPAILLKAKAEVSGKISYRHPDLKKGGSLPKGTLVIRIEPTTFEFTRDQSSAQLAASRSALQQLETEEASTRRSLTIARRNLAVGQKELDRLLTIWREKLIARASVDAEEQKVLQLRQQVEDLEGKLAAYASRKASILAEIKQARARLAQSQDTLGRTEVRLPFDARIGAVPIEEGEFVPAGATLFEALGTEAVEITAQLPTRQFRPLLLGLGEEIRNLQSPRHRQAMIEKMQLETTVRLVSQPRQQSWRGQLQRISESIDPIRDTIGLTVRVDHPYENVIPGIRPPLLKGMYVAVELLAPVREAWVLPRKALHQGRVYIATNDDRLEIRPVTIEHKQGNLIIVSSGLAAGERVIINDVIPVIDGLPLKPITATAAAREVAREAMAGTVTLPPSTAVDGRP